VGSARFVSLSLSLSHTHTHKHTHTYTDTDTHRHTHTQTHTQTHTDTHKHTHDTDTHKHRHTHTDTHTQTHTHTQRPKTVLEPNSKTTLLDTSSSVVLPLAGRAVAYRHLFVLFILPEAAVEWTTFRPSFDFQKNAICPVCVR
jgi:hypothetical protein